MTFGYGAITTFAPSYADAIGRRPQEHLSDDLGAVMLLTRPFFGAARRSARIQGRARAPRWR